MGAWKRALSPFLNCEMHCISVRINAAKDIMCSIYLNFAKQPLVSSF